MKPHSYKPNHVIHSSTSPSQVEPENLQPENLQLPFIQFRPYQRIAFDNKTDGIQIWLWARQIGKSFTLAAWAVDRLIKNPGRTVTVLSNSMTNGMEFNKRCAKVCRWMRQAFAQSNLTVDDRFESLRAETRITINGQVGRILILAANPETARGFTGDLILDEFAFHEDSAAIWHAASPTLASRPDFLCRIASTPKGKHNFFYRMCTSGLYPVHRVTRTDAFAHGVKIYHPITRQPIDPATARALDPDKRSYDRNYECVFEDENTALLTHELINAAERPGVGIVCEGEWSPEVLALLKAPMGSCPDRKTAREWIEGAPDQYAMEQLIRSTVCKHSSYRFDSLLRSNYVFSLGESFDEFDFPMNRDADRFLFAGVDVGRSRDRSVITVVERLGPINAVRAILRLDHGRLPQQQEHVEAILNISAVRMVKIDSTGLGLGLFEYTQNKFPDRVQGMNFSTTVPLESGVAASVNALHTHDRSSRLSVRVTELLATQLLQTFEDRSIQIPINELLRDDLRKPERIVSPSGRVSIAATRDEAGHADHFWSLALALDAAKTPIPPKFEWHAFVPRARIRCTTL